MHVNVRGYPLLLLANGRERETRATLFTPADEETKEKERKGTRFFVRKANEHAFPLCHALGEVRRADDSVSPTSPTG